MWLAYCMALPPFHSMIPWDLKVSPTEYNLQKQSNFHFLYIFLVSAFAKLQQH